MKYVVTCDQAVDHFIACTDVAVWGESALDLLGMNKDGEWEGNATSALDIIGEMTAEEFKEQYGLDAPKAGTKKMLNVEYAWE